MRVRSALAFLLLLPAIAPASFPTDADREKLVGTPTELVVSTPEVSLSFQGKSSLLGRPGIFLAVQGVAEIVRDKTQFEKHWTKDLNFYYPEGIDSPGLLLIKVRANRIHYWDGENEGEIRP